MSAPICKKRRFRGRRPVAGVHAWGDLGKWAKASRILPLAFSVRPLVSSWTFGQASSNLGTILPLGDSITLGVNFEGEFPGGSRDPFYQDAVAAGFAMQFVGSEGDHP